jgi:hypothetical protein
MTSVAPAAALAGGEEASASYETRQRVALRAAMDLSLEPGCEVALLVLPPSRASFAVKFVRPGNNALDLAKRCETWPKLAVYSGSEVPV